jgi:ParB-like chromosome segregation protein Spo0J
MIIDGVKRYYACKRLNYKYIQVKAREVFVEEFIGERFKIIK